MRYTRKTNDFPRLAVKRSDGLPHGCATLRAPATPLRVATSWTELDGSVWLEMPRGQRAPAVLEQSMPQQDGYQVTLLFIAGVDEDEDDEALEQSWAVRFPHR